MRPFLLALVVTVPLIKAAQARADLATYDITGTVVRADPGIPVAVGDKLTWTIQYDRSQAPAFTVLRYDYYVNGPVLTHLVDQTTGYHLSYPQNTTSGIELNGTFRNWGLYGEMDTREPLSNGYTALTLLSSGITASSTLANLRLGSITIVSGINPITSTLDYVYYSNNGRNGVYNDVLADVTSLRSRAPLTQAPEPGSLTLFALGALGLAGHGLRRRLTNAQPA